jgi:hypothetical protein
MILFFESLITDDSFFAAEKGDADVGEREGKDLTHEDRQGGATKEGGSASFVKGGHDWLKNGAPTEVKGSDIAVPPNHKRHWSRCFRGSYCVTGRPEFESNPSMIGGLSQESASPNPDPPSRHHLSHASRDCLPAGGLSSGGRAGGRSYSTCGSGVTPPAHCCGVHDAAPPA